ncbi:MAG: RtcB family protein [Candidatus Cloacimonetes bacterium]|nr:RtcB family protein [Candidatus Cloacimonadota bacterium]
MRIIDTENKPILLWLNQIEDDALQQTKNLANHPCLFKHVAIMPDAHTGFGMPIGGVAAFINAVVPNAVGVDIGCGMCALKTSIKQISKNQLEKIVSQIFKNIPVGFKHNKIPFSSEFLPSPETVPKNGIVNKHFSDARKQICSLGGGNHFIEIQKDTDNYVWIMIHSGSRNIGLKVAEHYRKLADEFCLKKNQVNLVKQQLSYLPSNSEEAKNYLSEMKWCINFALENRKNMLSVVRDIFTNIFKEIDFSNTINIAHNYAELEEHFGVQVYLHRKGATKAEMGTIGIIPGSQGTKSYIVSGRGNPESFKSCSHGAGRIMSRHQAVKNLNLRKEIEKLDFKGIIHGMKKRSDLDEASGAYKDINEVMRNQEDLVDILTILTPLAVVKG